MILDIDIAKTLGVSIFEADAMLHRLTGNEGIDVVLCERACEIFFRLPVCTDMHVLGKENKKDISRFPGMRKGSTNVGDVDIGGASGEGKDDDPTRIVRNFYRIGSFHVCRSDENIVSFQHFMWASKNMPFEAIPDKGVEYVLKREKEKFYIFGKEEEIGEYRFSFLFSFLLSLFLYRFEIRDVFLRVLCAGSSYTGGEFYKDGSELRGSSWSS